MSDRRVAAMTVLLALVVSACDWWMPSPNTPASASPTVLVLSDSAIKSLIIRNIKGDPDAISAIPLDVTRAPNIMVRDGVLMVATTDPASAASLCRTISAMTNSPDTGAPLGITEIVIIVPVQQPVASCRP
jgi:hypothetical protein